MSQGVPFIHAGQEFLRSKQGVENSYKSSDEINSVYWENADKHWEFVEMVKDLIEIRSEYNIFRQDRKSIIKNSIKLSTKTDNRSSISMYGKGIDESFYVIFKNNYDYEYIDFERVMTIVFDGRKRTDTVCESIEMNKPGVYILKRGGAN